MFTARYVLHSTFFPHNVFMCFVWIWEQTAIISLYSIDWLVFITETKCVYCAVQTGSSYVIRVNFPTPKCCAIAQAVNRRPLIADARVRSQASPCEICGRQSGTVTSFSPSTSVFLSQYHSTHAPHTSTCCSQQKDKPAKLANRQKEKKRLFRKSGNTE